MLTIIFSLSLSKNYKIIVHIVTDMKIKKLMPMDAESRRLIDWMEKGISETYLHYLISLGQELIHTGITLFV